MWIGNRGGNVRQRRLPDWVESSYVRCIVIIMKGPLEADYERFRWHRTQARYRHTPHRSMYRVMTFEQHMYCPPPPYIAQ